MNTKPLSLTLRLFLSLSVLLMVALFTVGLLGLRSADNKISEDYDNQLITACDILWQVTHRDIDKGDYSELGVVDIDAQTPLLNKAFQESLSNYAKWRAFRIWKGNKIVMQSDNSEDFPSQPIAPGLSNLAVQGEVWRVFALHVPQEQIVVETFENLRNRTSLRHDITMGIAVPLLALAPLLALLLSLSIRFGLAKLRWLAHRLETRSPSDLSQLPSADIPKELKPLVLAVNNLLVKLEQALTHEREFIDHAAHELRTPLSALKLQAQIIAKSVTEPAQRGAVQELLTGVDRATRLTDQLLLLSRLTYQTITLIPVNLHEAARTAIGMHALPAIDKQINLGLEGNETLRIMAQQDLLGTLISTILENAIKYTPRGGEVTLSVTREKARALLVITDTGEGIPEEERQHVFDRFYRAERTKQSGSGLGLAIAKQIADLLQATITLARAPSGKGLSVIIVFPLT